MTDNLDLTSLVFTFTASIIATLLKCPFFPNTFSVFVSMFDFVGVVLSVALFFVIAVFLFIVATLGRRSSLSVLLVVVPSVVVAALFVSSLYIFNFLSCKV